MDSSFGQTQNYYAQSRLTYKLSEENITCLNVHMLDQNDNFIDFNNIEWYMNIAVSFQYKKEMKQAIYLKDSLNGDAFETAEEYLNEEATRNRNAILDNYIYEHKLIKNI